MVKGFKATLFAGVITLGAVAPAFAVGPIITGLPDVHIGDMENSDSTDNNLFVFSDAFQFSNYVSDTDTADSALRWSFGEFTNPALAGPQYTVNGVGPINNGDLAIAAEEAGDFPLAKAAATAATGRINDGNDFATFRDIIFSPTSGTAPYPDPSPANATAAAEGKALRFYVADPEGNVAYQDTLIRTVDDQFDVLTATDGYQEVVRDSTFTSGWVQSGIPTSTVAISSTTEELKVTVQADNIKYRLLGWVNNTLMSYDSVGAGKYVRGKFFVSTTNPYSAPSNQVPAFRVRITNAGAVNAATHYDYALSGNTDPGYEPFYFAANNPTADLVAGQWVRPSDNTTTPSLYRVDLDPVDAPEAVGSNIGALLESNAINALGNGTLSLHEVVLATYDALTDSDGTLIYDYNRATGLAAGAGGLKTATLGAFNAENDLLDGHRPRYYLPGRDVEGYAVGNMADVNGPTADTDPVIADRFGLALVNFSSTSNADRPRISPDKLYRARYYATSSVPAYSNNPAVEGQGAMRFKFQTAAGTITHFLDMPSPNGLSLGAKGDALVRQVIPGTGSSNPEQDAALNTASEAGGWYSIIVPSPLDSNGIRADQNDNFGTLGAEPGPGSTSASARDILLGVELFQQPTTLKLGSSSFTFASPNRGQVRLSAVRLYEVSPIDDGGYDYND